ncbi:hypothetical protein Ae201684_001839 [Aphanomyces euteiches]|uniref:Uncharacterized protein n=1 Tax=Aphanomyces euteiches TaxID=100861 RepID=A0A6G0XSJ0_9STRA|nr:hypothetical protein Ae201684_001839 [Aphanomyces euteiches]
MQWHDLSKKWHDLTKNWHDFEKLLGEWHDREIHPYGGRIKRIHTVSCLLTVYTFWVPWRLENASRVTRPWLHISWCSPHGSQFDALSRFLHAIERCIAAGDEDDALLVCRAVHPTTGGSHWTFALVAMELVPSSQWMVTSRRFPRLNVQVAWMAVVDMLHALRLVIKGRRSAAVYCTRSCNATW